MVIDIMTIIFVGIPAAIGYATAAFRLFDKITPLTKTLKDDNFVKNGLKILTVLTENVSFNKAKKEVNIKINK